MTAATPDRPAQLGRTDNQPKAYGRLEPRAAQVQGPSGSVASSWTQPHAYSALSRQHGRLQMRAVQSKGPAPLR